MNQEEATGGSARAGRAKVALYFDLLPDVRRDGAVAELRAKAARIAGTFGDDVDQRLAALISLASPLPHQNVMANSPKSFAFAYQLSTADPAQTTAMADAVTVMWTALRPSIDEGNAAVMIGWEIAITRGDGPVFNIMPLRRLSHLSHDDFMRDWFDRHAALGEGVQGVRYRQNHIDAGATQALADRIGVSFPPMDGVTESYFDDSDAAVAVLSQDVVAIDAIDDERRFIDHARSQFGLYDTIWRSEG